VNIQKLVDGQHQRDDDSGDDSGDEHDFAELDGECDAAAEWRVAKADHKLTSKSMDELMKLTGLNEIKRKAMDVVKEVLLQKDQPASVKAETSMNFRDMSDEELKQVLVSMASKCGLVFENLDLIASFVALVAQKRRMPGFGNAGTVGSMLNFEKLHSAGSECRTGSGGICQPLQRGAYHAGDGQARGAHFGGHSRRTGTSRDTR
jgi:hypothetical protein